jgi:SET domain-containing protein
MSRKSLRLGRSLTGFGVFATQEIRKRARLAEYRGRLLPTPEAERIEAGGNRYLFEINTRWTIDGTTRRNFARYINHSCNPNAEAYVIKRRVFIRALRRIKPGEEIAYDYGRDYLKNVIGLSNCKCGRCRRRKAKRKREAYARKKRAAARARSKRTSKRAQGRR